MTNDRHNRLKTLCALGLFVLLSILMTWPLITGMHKYVTDYGDPLLNAWILAWDVHSLQTNPLGIFDTNIFYPHMKTLAYSEHMFANALLVLPIFLAGGSPVLAHNILFLGSFILCGFGMFLLVRRLTGSGSAGVVAGLLFAFCPFRFEQMPHLQILSCQWIPFTFLFLHRFFARFKTSDLVLFCVFFVIQALSSSYIALFTAMSVSLYAAYGLMSIPTVRSRRILLRLILAAGIVGIILLPTVLPYFQVQREMGFTRSINESVVYSAKLESYLAFPLCNRLFGHMTKPFRQPEGVLFPGSVCIVAALALLVRALIRFFRNTREQPPDNGRSRRPAGLLWAHRVSLVLFATCICGAIAIGIFGDLSFSIGSIKVGLAGLNNPLQFAILTGLVATATSRRAKAVARSVAARFTRHDIPFFYVLLGFVAFLVSLGPIVRVKDAVLGDGPYIFFYNHVPGFQGIRVPARIGMIVVFAMAVLTGYAFVWITARMRRAWMRGLVLCFLSIWICVENFCIPKNYRSVDTEPAACYSWLAEQDDDFSIIELPMYADNIAHREAAYVLDSTHHWKKLVNGYSGFFPPATLPIKLIMSSFPGDESIALLRRLGVRYAVIHWWRMEPRDIRRVKTSLQQHADDLAMRFESEQDSVVEILADSEPHAPWPEFREIPQNELVVTAGNNRDVVTLAVDGDINTRWTTHKTQAKGMWFQIDLGRERRLTRLELFSGRDKHDFPWHAVFQTSCDGKTWTGITDSFGRVEFVLDCIRNPVEPSMQFNFEPRNARYLRIQLAASIWTYWWSIAEVRVYEAEPIE